MKYTVYFDVFGKKMKTTVDAKNLWEAERVVKSNLKIHKIKEEVDSRSSGEETLNHLKNIFGIN